MRDAFIAELDKLASNDPSIMLLTGDLGFGVLTDYAEKHPNQYINVGVAEQNMSGLACGLALEGYKVYTYSIANFTTLRCLEQIRNDICYHDADVTIVSVGAGFSYGQLGVSHFATEDLAILRALPNISVIAPSDPWEAKILVNQMHKNHGPKYLRIDKGSAGSIENSEEVFLGKGRVVMEGSDLTLISVGAILKESIKAAELLLKKGIKARVISLNTIKPLDKEIVIKAAHETGGIISIEEHSLLGGLSGSIAETLFRSSVMPKFFKSLGIPDEYPTIVGDQNYLRDFYNLNADGIIKVVQSCQEELNKI